MALLFGFRIGEQFYTTYPKGVCAAVLFAVPMCILETLDWAGRSSRLGLPFEFKSLDHAVRQSVITDDSTMVLDDLGAPPARQIPRIIHQYYKSVTRLCHVELMRLRDTWNKFLPNDWDFTFWSDDTNRRMVAEHYPSFLEIYDGYSSDARRADVATVLLMHRHGGVYADLDVELLRDPSPIFGSQEYDIILFYEERFQSASQKGALGLKVTLDGRQGVTAALMASIPHHPFWMFVLSRLTEKNDENSAFAATGLDLLTTALADYREQFPDARIGIMEQEVWSPLSWMDGTKGCMGRKGLLTWCGSKFNNSTFLSHWSLPPFYKTRDVSAAGNVNRGWRYACPTASFDNDKPVIFPPKSLMQTKATWRVAIGIPWYETHLPSTASMTFDSFQGGAHAELAGRTLELHYFVLHSDQLQDDCKSWAAPNIHFVNMTGAAITHLQKDVQVGMDILRHILKFMWPEYYDVSEFNFWGWMDMDMFVANLAYELLQALSAAEVEPNVITFGEGCHGAIHLRGHFTLFATRVNLAMERRDALAIFYTRCQRLAPDEGVFSSRVLRNRRKFNVAFLPGTYEPWCGACCLSVKDHGCEAIYRSVVFVKKSGLSRVFMLKVKMESVTSKDIIAVLQHFDMAPSFLSGEDLDVKDTIDYFGREHCMGWVETPFQTCFKQHGLAEAQGSNASLACPAYFSYTSRLPDMKVRRVPRHAFQTPSRSARSLWYLHYHTTWRHAMQRIPPHFRIREGEALVIDRFEHRFLQVYGEPDRPQGMPKKIMESDCQTPERFIVHHNRTYWAQQRKAWARNRSLHAKSGQRCVPPPPLDYKAMPWLQ